MVLTLVPDCWSAVASAQDEAYVLDFIHMTGPLAGWAVTAIREPGPNALLHTIDGGAHWEDVTPPGLLGVSRPAVLTAGIAWLEASTLLHTTDGGRTWRDFGRPPLFRASGNRTLFLADGMLDFIDARNGWRMMGAGAPGREEVYIHRTADGGATWVPVSYTTTIDETRGLPLAGTKTGITFLNATTGWVTGRQPGCDHAFLFATRDGGHTWRRLRLSLPPQVTSHWNGYTMAPQFFSARDGVLPMVVSYSAQGEYCEDGKQIVVFYVTRDGGATWLATSPVEAHGGPAWSFADLDHGWVLGDGVLYRAANGGRRWAAIPLPSEFGDIRQLDFVSPQTGWAVRGSLRTLKTTPSSLLKTTDGGQTWVPVAYTVSRR